MSPSLAFFIRRSILASTAAIALGTVACSWNLGYLESGKDAANDGSSTSDVGARPEDASVADTGPGNTPDAGSQDVSSPPVESGPYFGDGGNLIENPSCQDGIVDWSTLGATPLESSTTVVHSGDSTSCWSYGRTGGTYNGPQQDITTVVVPGHQYSVSAWVLWAVPGAADGGLEKGTTDAGDDDAYSSPSSDGAADAASDASVGAGSSLMESVYITIKTTCGTSETVGYIRAASGTDLPEGTWTFVDGQATPFTVPTACSDYALYVEGPDIGLDLYVDEVTLTFVN